MAQALPSTALKQTFRLEVGRAVTGGIIEAFSMTFVLYFLDRVFHANDTAKATVISMQRGGLLFGFLVVVLAQRWHMAPSRMTAYILMVASLGMALSACANTTLVFAIGVSIASFLWSTTPPLVTQYYRANYPGSMRGRLFSASAIVRSCAAIAFGYAAGRFLEIFPTGYATVMWVAPVAFLIGAVLVWHVPTDQQLHSQRRLEKGSYWAAFRWLKQDRRFALAIAAWMFVGMGMLMTAALLVEYITNPVYGQGYTASDIAFVTIAIPTSTQLLTTFLWGGLFDRLPFFRLRLVLNTLGSLAILVIFLSHHFVGVCIGTALLGIFRGGGHVAWNLWVTKMAPEDHVGEYMSVHTFFTGIRGMATPFLGFYLLRHHGSEVLGWTCFACVTLSSILVVPLLSNTDQD